MITSILPGATVEVVAGSRPAELSVTGVVAMALPLSWGDKVTTIHKGDSTLFSLGYRLGDPNIKLPTEVLKSAQKLILYRLDAEGTKATGVLAEDVSATAVYAGTRGNDISVVVTENGDRWLVKTYLGTTEVDSQLISGASDFVPAYVALEGEGSLAAATVKLEGGSNGTPEETYDGFFAECEKHQYNVICSTEAARAAAVVAFVDEQHTKKNYVQGVVTGMKPNNKNIYVNSSVGGVTTAYDLTPAEACATLAGLVAKVGATGSLTHYNGIPGWIDVQPRLTREQQIAKVQDGETLFVMLHSTPAVLYDINSLTQYTDDNPKDFGKGLVMRTLNQYQSDVQILLDTRCVGKIRNSETGRAEIKSRINDLTVQQYLNPGYIEGFTADDISVLPGTERDEVVVTVGILVADTADKIYVTVTAL